MELDMVITITELIVEAIIKTCNKKNMEINKLVKMTDTSGEY